MLRKLAFVCFLFLKVPAWRRSLTGFSVAAPERPLVVRFFVFFASAAEEAGGSAELKCEPPYRSPALAATERARSAGAGWEKASSEVERAGRTRFSPSTAARNVIDGENHTRSGQPPLYAAATWEPDRHCFSVVAR